MVKNWTKTEAGLQFDLKSILAVICIAPLEESRSSFAAMLSNCESQKKCAFGRLERTDDAVLSSLFSCFLRY